MPMYTYICIQCFKENDILRPLSQCDEPMTDKEFGLHLKGTCKGEKYQKILKGAPKKAYGPNWGGSKGNW